MKKVNSTLLLLFCSVILWAQRGVYVAEKNGGIKAPPAEKRYALVIGNKDYQHVSPLKNPLNDATDMAKVLTELGFDVETLQNVGLIAMNKAIKRFAEKARGENAVALFFYAGHGVQVESDNWLVPIDADVQTPVEVQSACVSLKLLTDHLQQANTGMNIIILDACRNNPFKYNRETSGGLAQPKHTPKGTYIAFATSPFVVASDGTGRNSPYTEALKTAITTPNIKIEDMFKQVRRIMEKINQTPWENSSLVGDFYFNPKSGGSTIVPTTQDSDGDGIVDSKDRCPHEYGEIENGGCPYRATEVLEKGRKLYEDKDYIAAFPIFYAHSKSSDFMPSDAFILGHLYHTGGGVTQDYNEAIKWYRKAAAQGDAKAQNNLGVMYANGHGVGKDYDEAFKWYRKAAEQGAAKAQNALGSMYENGHGVGKDYDEAVKWYRKAAEQGHADGQVKLGLMYFHGRGITQDDVEAIKWYRKAAEQGYGWGQNNLGAMYVYGRGVIQDYDEAVKWFSKAAEQGNVGGQTSLGTMYDNGRGVIQDYDEAVKWFRKAAEQGYAGGQTNLGTMYAAGRGVKKDYHEAVKWHRKAAEQGNATGQYNLGNMYADGHGVRKDDNEAVKWYRKAAEQGDAIGQSNLGYMYLMGRGVPQSKREAIYWYEKAAAQGDEIAKNNLKILR